MYKKFLKQKRLNTKHTKIFTIRKEPKMLIISRILLNIVSNFPTHGPNFYLMVILTEILNLKNLTR